MTTTEPTKATGAALRRGRSKQDYGTPWEFIRAVEGRWGPILLDLAAHAGNAKAPLWIGEEEDSLSVSWSELCPTGNLWLNPPFANIAPWAAKCHEEAAKRSGLIFLLTPASIGSEWFHAHVYQIARVLGLRPRIPFEGPPINPKTGKPDGYPKDLMLSIYGEPPGLDTWRWDRTNATGGA